jgi:hypothetical protein
MRRDRSSLSPVEWNGVRGTKPNPVERRHLLYGGKVRTWETATRMQATLATRLRPAPQARTDPKTIARMPPAYHSPKPWDEKDW